MTSRVELDRKLLAAAERLGRALRAARQHQASRHGLSLLQLLLVERLADGRPRRVGELAAELDVSQPTASDALSALAAKALVERGPDPADRRASAVSLTGAGAGLAAEIARELSPLLRASADRSEVESATALRVLLSEIARLQQAGVISVNRSCLGCHHYGPPDATAPARCHLLGLPLADRDLRVDCPDHLAA